MRRAVPLPPASASPSPRETKQWMLEVTAFLRSVEGEAGLLPQTVLLESWTTTAKATVDGVLMYDRSTNSIMLAVGGEWLPISPATIAYLLSATGAFGGMKNNAPGASFNITPTWTIVTAYDTVHVTPYNTTFDTTNNWFTLGKPGIYTLYVNMSLSHNADPNNPRVLLTRSRNLDTGAVSPTFYSAVSEKTGATTFAVTTVTELPLASVGTRYVIEVACNAGDTFTGVTIYNATIAVVLSGALP